MYEGFMNINEWCTQIGKGSDDMEVSFEYIHQQGGDMGNELQLMAEELGILGKEWKLIGYGLVLLLKGDGLLTQEFALLGKEGWL